jgi:hypothetical protein
MVFPMSETITPPAFEVRLPSLPPSKGDSEYRAFLELLPELLKTHRNKYVAIHLGRVVDCDDDDIALVKRMHAAVGYVPIHVGLVVEPQPVVRVPHYRECQAGGDGT